VIKIPRGSQGADFASEERRQHSVPAGGQQERSEGKEEGVVAGGDPEVHTVGRAVRRNLGQDPGKRGQGIFWLPRGAGAIKIFYFST